MAVILDGKILAKNVSDDLIKEIESLKSQTGDVPSIVNILIGEDDGSCAYANSQKKAAEKIGIHYKTVTLANDITQEKLEDYIEELNADAGINGIMLHKPVPDHIDYSAAANYLDSDKDLEGINVANIGKLIRNETKIIPCTPAAVMEHIRSTGVDIRGKEAVIVGHSEIVGKPLTLLLLDAYATVSVCHVATSEAGKLRDHVNRADILVVAVGKESLIKGDWVKEKSIVIDVGINRVNGKIVGDVEFVEAEKKAAFITPVPGGVGPVTVMMLMRNAIEAFKKQIQKGENAQL